MNEEEEHDDNAFALLLLPTAFIQAGRERNKPSTVQKKDKLKTVIGRGRTEIGREKREREKEGRGKERMELI